MNATKQFKKVLSLVLALVMLVGLLPLSAVQASAQTTEPIVVIAASDYQDSGSDPEGQTKALLSRIVQDYPTAEGFLFGGDYSTDSQKESTTKEGRNELDGIVDTYYPAMSDENQIYIQGNHDYYSSLLATSGEHDTDYYGVYVINHKDFPKDASSSTVQSTANALKTYLDQKAANGYSKPIFVLSHLPLHIGRGDNKNATLLADVLNKAGEEGLNIIFMVGHNHSGTYDDYLGNAAVYLPEGSSLPVANTSGGYTTYTTNFTYMNYGYVGFINSKTDSTLTATVFEITEDEVVVKRYGKDGLHNLKAKGISVSGRPTDSRVIASPATISLGAPVPAVEVKNADGTVTVKAPGLTGLVAEKVTSSYDAATYSAYVTYDITPAGYIQGTTATVTVRLDAADGFDTSKPVLVLDNGKELTRTSIVDGTVTFTTNHFSTYSFAQTVATGYTYELATEIVSGEQYVIVSEDGAYGAGDTAYAMVTVDPQENFEGGVQAVEVDDTGALLTAEEKPVLWTFEKASNGTYKIKNADDNRVLGHKDSYWYENGTGDTEFDITKNNDGIHFRLFAGSSRLAFRHEGDNSRNPWSRNNDSDSEPEYVRLYRAIGSTGSNGGETVKPDTEGWVTITETVENGNGYVYELDTDGIDTGVEYLIVANSYDKALTKASNSSNFMDVEINGDKIQLDSDSYGWTFTKYSNGVYYIRLNGSTYLRTSSSKLSSDTKESADGRWTATANGDGSYHLVRSKYNLRWSNSNNVFQVSSSNKGPVRLYKYAGTGAGTKETYVRLSGNLTQNYTTDAPTLDAVLNKLMIQTSGDGNNVDATIPVTAEMVKWDKAFDGSVAGTYTGTVSYEGKTLGNVVVTVTSAHQFETVTVDATCITDGSITTTCTVCGQQTVEVIPATGHTYTTTEIAATCVQDGSMVYTCACGDSYTEVIPAIGHSYEAVVTAPTCTEAGYTTYTCSCGDTYVADEVAATGHSYEAKTTAPGCSEEGKTVYTCACGDTYTEVIPATGKHTYQAVTVAPTCETDGITTYTCDCGDAYTVEIPALGHDYTAKVTAPTCEKEGYTAYTCACGDSYVTDEVAALGHDYTAKVTAPTCEKEGYTTYTCACGDSYVTDEVAALGHDYTAKVTAPTCEKEGYTTYACACGDRYTTDKVAALGHDYTAKVTAPTCEKAGYTTYTCEDCNHSYIGNQVEALGHDYICEESDGYLVYTCSACGESYSEKLNLTYTKVSDMEDDNRYVIVAEAGKQYYALTHADNTIGIVKVTISNNEIVSQVTEDMVWTYSDNKLSYEDDDKVYSMAVQAAATNSTQPGNAKKPGAATATLVLSTTDAATVSIDKNKIKLDSYYLNFNKDKVKVENKGSNTIFFCEN